MASFNKLDLDFHRRLRADEVKKFKKNQYDPC
jgi:hypothetical protein